MNSEDFRTVIQTNWNKNELPEYNDLYSLLEKTYKTLKNEKTEYRPLNKNKEPGSLLTFNDNLPVIIVPDLHARPDFLLSIINFVLPNNGHTVLELLEKKQLRIICVGDGLHSEKRGKERWFNALHEYDKDNILNEYMVEEMKEGLSLITLVMLLKIFFPEEFHFLRGNHENILNEDSEGNHSFRKFVLEGAMVFDFMLEKYDITLLSTYSEFEKSLPLFVIDKRFLVSHAEPADFYTKKELLNASLDSEVCEGLIWTPNDVAATSTVKKMLKTYCNDFDKVWYFAGHRPVQGIYNLNESNHFIQFHNPDRMTIAVIPTDRCFDPERDFYDVSNGGINHG